MKSDLGVSYLFNLHISSLNLLLFFKIFLLFWFLNSNKEEEAAVLQVSL
ncbi:MAG: hypothetical protein RHS_0482 [Robinsoniella sp. RHS]|nr:MAG: hypothetical protein RHS_0482 [Robinsoniella sp. RHS]